ncbi:hypothetical protein TIFTF001_055975 [Ficus carica]|uniref:Uncharacterized protein n=1 Tax=Ficus carica TaxID=3494 RepID=A0AA88EF12_FICCA|nr:hypothetical protein TIFTF001_055975 [Ficus carica]
MVKKFETEHHLKKQETNRKVGRNIIPPPDMEEGDKKGKPEKPDRDKRGPVLTKGSNARLGSSAYLRGCSEESGSLCDKLICR